MSYSLASIYQNRMFQNEKEGYKKVSVIPITRLLRDTSPPPAPKKIENVVDSQINKMYPYIAFYQKFSLPLSITSTFMK